MCERSSADKRFARSGNLGDKFLRAIRQLSFLGSVGTRNRRSEKRGDQSGFSLPCLRCLFITCSNGMARQEHNLEIVWSLSDVVIEVASLINAVPGFPVEFHHNIGTGIDLPFKEALYLYTSYTSHQQV